MLEALEWLVHPMQYAFMVRGLLAAILVGVVCGMVGCFVILRGMAFFGDALSHSVLPGVAAGYLMGGGRGAMFWWALGTAIFVSVAIGAVSKSGRLKEDTSVGILFAGMLALGVAMISSVRSYSVDLVHFLFGDVLGVSWYDLGLMGAFGLLVIMTLFLFFKEFIVVSFDETLARTLRLPTRFLYYLLLILMAITIVTALQTVGVAMLLAMLVTPPATAYLITRRLPVMMAVSASLGALSGVIGLYISYYWGIASGASIVLVSTFFFLLALALRPLHHRSRQSA